MKKALATLTGIFITAIPGTAAEVTWFNGSSPVTYQVEGKTSPVVKMALEMFCSDMEKVTGMRPVTSRNAAIRVIAGKGTDDGFRMTVTKNRQIVIEGHSQRGAAYGLLEISRMAGVSPWVWWGDVVPEKRKKLTIAEDFCIDHKPSVNYRGIFINDEDWSLRNWAWKNYERSDRFGVIGPKTYKALFQLMLRLRANVIWPAMHEGTAGFFTIPGNKEMADSFGILIGTSHCEPMLRNNVAEWDRKTMGDYNYITNRERVKNYWAERLKQVRGSQELFTIGMRGIHDGSMEGVKTKEEKLSALQQVIDDQRELLRKYYHKDVEQVPQVFIPYKEVLQIMESGLKVPDDVTLMWCDDNYGYMTRLSDEEQQKRSGGGGVYYHLSYWGRPHDYLWLTTTQPGLIYSEMKTAYEHNCRQLWIVNVHDPKVAAYDLQLFLDMAWDIEGIVPSEAERKKGAITLEEHLERWLGTQFGKKAAAKLLPAMKEFYRLCAIRKPEFMGWTQVELDKKIYPRGRSQVIDTEFTNEFGGEMERYLSQYEKICKDVKEAETLVAPELKEAYFAHVKYPVLAANAMAVKALEAQMARAKYQGQTGKDAEGREEQMMKHSARAIQAYRDIQLLTQYYNDSLANGKWKGLMNMMPRDLPTFNPPTLPYLPPENYKAENSSYNAQPLATADAIARNACQYQSATQGIKTIQMLGHSMNAVSIPKGEEVTYEFTVTEEMLGQNNGKATLYTAMIPTQPNDKGDLRYSIQMDQQQPEVISLKEKYRSEFWKLSVMRGQALKQIPVQMTKGRHTLKIKAIDEHIIADQWMIDFRTGRKFYVIPVG